MHIGESLVEPLGVREFHMGNSRPIPAMAANSSARINANQPSPRVALRKKGRLKRHFEEVKGSAKIDNAELDKLSRKSGKTF